jgi:hypothetical protein
MAGSVWGPGRHARMPSHPRCPGRAWYGRRSDAVEAAKRLGSVAKSCERCGGFHMTLPKAGAR